jgi:hypothetical protein
VDIKVLDVGLHAIYMVGEPSPFEKTVGSIDSFSSSSLYFVGSSSSGYYRGMRIGHLLKASWHVLLNN